MMGQAYKIWETSYKIGDNFKIKEKSYEIRAEAVSLELKAEKSTELEHLSFCSAWGKVEATIPVLSFGPKMNTKVTLLYYEHLF